MNPLSFLVTTGNVPYMQAMSSCKELACGDYDTHVIFSAPIFGSSRVRASGFKSSVRAQSVFLLHKTVFIGNNTIVASRHTDL